MLTELMTYLRHYWAIHEYSGKFAVEAASVGTKDVTLTLPDEARPAVGQYIYIRGALNRAVCRVDSVADSKVLISSDVPLSPDTIQFVAILAIPPAVIRLAEDIAAWSVKRGDGMYQSESFGGWSGTKAEGKNGVQTWQEHYSDALMPYRRMFADMSEVQ